MLFLELKNAYDLFEKIEYQFNKFKENEIIENNTYILWDIILSLNHLPEWIIKDNDLDIKIKISCIEKFSPYDVKLSRIPKEIKNIIHEIPNYKHSELQLIIREISNSNKHFEIKKSTIKKKTMQVSFGGYPGNDVFMDNPLQNSYYTQVEKYTVIREKKETDLIDIITKLIGDWRNFINCIYT